MISVLSPLSLTVGGVDITPTAPKLRTIIAHLALRRNSVVAIESLIRELWGEEPPVSATATLQTYMYQLRRILTQSGLNSKDILLTKPVGYEMRLRPEELDLDIFRNLVDQARNALQEGVDEAALEVVDKALGMCLATPLHDVSGGEVLESYIGQLRESVLEAVELRIEAKLRLGYHQEVIAELKSLCVENPYHENLHTKLMISLQRMGRRSDALIVYQTIRRNLQDELGIDPSASLQELQSKLLHADSSAVSEIESAWEVRRTITPAQLPGNIEEFTGRASEIERLRYTLTSSQNTLSPTIVTLTGSPGTGKSALAVRVCHEIRECFSHGQLYADLGGGTVEPYQVLGRFLRGAGFKGQEIPADLDERSQLFRSWTGQHQVLILLDNAASRAQVRPLLTSRPGSAVLITGTHLAVGGLEGSRPFRLDAPSLDECVAILRSMVGAEWVAGKEDVAYEVARSCDQLPVALRIVAAKLATGVYTSLTTAAQRLRAPEARLEELRFGEWDIRETYTAGYRLLDGQGRKALTMMAVSGLSSMTSVRIAELCSWERGQAEHVLTQLEQLRFLHSVAAGIGPGSYIMPPLVQSFMDGLMNGELALVRAAGT
ncbi:BTAD domain-containing putative transcriptional regulator [Streptomyces sp. NPDC004232]|uniref:AfsR/SARP family transcriptional regulator n=1 Tax=Streptomyces sp. NPDC004232 TaxID=3154454 RepID=UPI0033B2C134